LRLLGGWERVELSKLGAPPSPLAGKADEG